MGDYKHFLLSKTVWGIGLSMAAMFLPKIGIDPFSENDVASLANEAVAITAAAFAIWGRFKADTKLTK